MYFKSTTVSPTGVAFAACAMIVCALPAAAQDSDMLQKLMEVKQSSDANKKALAAYTWQETETISLRGEVKKTTTYQVAVGPDGKQQKTQIGGSAAPAPSGGKFKQRIIAKKKEEFQEYGEQIAALAKEYTPPNGQLLQQAYKNGNISAKLGGASGTVSLVIKNYLKPNDSMTLVFNREAKAIENLQIASYLSDPSDAVNISVTFAKLPSGVNHVAATQVDGVSKQLGVNTQNSNYQPAQPM